MPLRNHFQPKVQIPSWEGFHTTWATMIAQQLNQILPPQYRAVPTCKYGPQIEVDVAGFALANGTHSDKKVPWTPAKPSFSSSIDWPDDDTFEVGVFDIKEATLVGAVELVSPANKDRFTTRRSFAGKCAGYLRHNVGLIVVDVVSTRQQNLHQETLQLLELEVPEHEWTLGTPPLYAVAYRTYIVERMFPEKDQGQLELWSEALTIGDVLPTLPLWLSADFVVPVDLESTYQAAWELLNL